MARQVINNGETGLSVRTKLNDMTEELYNQGITTFHTVGDGNGLSNNLLVVNSTLDTAARVHFEPNGYPSGTKSKLDFMLDPYDGQSGADVSYRVMTLYATDSDAEEKVNGRTLITTKSTGHQWGIWPTLEIGFQDGSQLCMRMFYFDTNKTSWYTPMKGGWVTGTSYTTGDYVLANNNVYQATTTGTSGATRPSHESSTASDGGVTWSFVEALDDGGMNVEPRIVVTNDPTALPQSGFPDVGLELQRDLLVRSNVALAFESNTGVATWEFQSRFADDGMWLVNVNPSGNDGFWRFDSGSNFVQKKGIATLHTPTEINPAGATPSIAGAECIRIAQSGATNVTGFTGALTYQEFLVIFADANTTLVHGGDIILRSGGNETPAAGTAKRFLFSASKYVEL